MSGHSVTSTAFTAGRARAWNPARTLALALRVASTRKALPDLDDRMLADIGITREEALAEAARAPWDITPRAAPRLGFWRWTRDAIRRRYERTLITRLDTALARDLGISRTDLQTEADKPFWRL
jgi:uncharacterized protein YjiS (DUF1127 family)